MGLCMGGIRNAGYGVRVVTRENAESGYGSLLACRMLMLKVLVMGSSTLRNSAHCLMNCLNVKS